MRRRQLLSLGVASAAAGWTFSAAMSANAQGNLLKQGTDLLGKITGGDGGGVAAGLTDGEIGAGLKEALRVGTEAVVKQLGAKDGFAADPAIHIPLPDTLKTVKETLSKFGMSGMLDDLELKLNRAAEAATPRAQELFQNAITEMTLEDVKGILNGPEDAATRFFQGKMTDPLAADMKPIVDSTLAEVGAVKAYDDVMSQYKDIPLVPDVKADLTTHVLDRGIDGIFEYVAKEEAAIRANPAKRTTELLQKVFAN